jgi:hypothetical protein
MIVGTLNPRLEAEDTRQQVFASMHGVHRQCPKDGWHRTH